MERGCAFIRMNPQIDNSEATHAWARALGLIPAAIHHMDGEYCWVLDIKDPEESLLSSMRKTTRYEIRKAQKEGVEVFATTNPAYLSEFFDLYEQTSKRHGFVRHTGIKEEFEVFAKKQQAVLYIGRHNKQTVSAAIVLYFGNQAIYHHGASIHSPVPVSTLVQWQAILDAKKRGVSLYNFWGIAPDNSPKHPWRGLTLFKKGFGGRDIEYFHAHDLPLTWKYWVARGVEMVRKLKKGYD
jgi:lipid II:glycine glycyltransferase (peptidoglycan interpeptide bridge formation enzyme)